MKAEKQIAAIKLFAGDERINMKRNPFWSFFVVLYYLLWPVAIPINLDTFERDIMKTGSKCLLFGPFCRLYFIYIKPIKLTSIDVCILQIFSNICIFTCYILSIYFL